MALRLHARVGRAAAVQFFAFLNQVRPRGGGTLVLTGSHRLAASYLGCGEAFRMARVRASVAAHPCLRGLWEPVDGSDRIQRYMNDWHPDERPDLPILGGLRERRPRIDCRAERRIFRLPGSRRQCRA